MTTLLPRAILSADGLYRYRIECDVPSGPGPACGMTFGFFGINPGTAATGVHDQTTRKWTGFTFRWGGRRWIAGNVAAWRDSDVRALQHIEDPVGPDNDWHLRRIIDEADVLVPCWGARAKIPARVGPRLVELRRLLLSSGKPVRVFGWTKCQQPMHPLMLGYATPLQDWRS